MLFTVEGKYQDGRITLAEEPDGVRQARVLVTFLSDRPHPAPRQMTFGQFSGERMSTEEDLRIAEWRGESEAGDERA
jgi:hypothetical protein